MQNFTLVSELTGLLLLTFVLGYKQTYAWKGEYQVGSNLQVFIRTIVYFTYGIVGTALVGLVELSTQGTFSVQSFCGGSLLGGILYMTALNFIAADTRLDPEELSQLLCVFIAIIGVMAVRHEHSHPAEMQRYLKNLRVAINAEVSVYDSSIPPSSKNGPTTLRPWTGKTALNLTTNSREEDNTIDPPLLDHGPLVGTAEEK